MLQSPGLSCPRWSGSLWSSFLSTALLSIQLPLPPNNGLQPDHALLLPAFSLLVCVQWVFVLTFFQSPLCTLCHIHTEPSIQGDCSKEPDMWPSQKHNHISFVFKLLLWSLSLWKVFPGNTTDTLLENMYILRNQVWDQVRDQVTNLDIVYRETFTKMTTESRTL